MNFRLLRRLSTISEVKYLHSKDKKCATGSKGLFSKRLLGGNSRHLRVYLLISVLNVTCIPYPSSPGVTLAHLKWTLPVPEVAYLKTGF